MKSSLFLLILVPFVVAHFKERVDFGTAVKEHIEKRRNQLVRDFEETGAGKFYLVPGLLAFFPPYLSKEIGSENF